MLFPNYYKDEISGIVEDYIRTVEIDAEQNAWIGTSAKWGKDIDICHQMWRGRNPVYIKRG